MTLTLQQQANRDLHDYVWHTLCEKCRNLLADRSSPNEWEECRATGLCSICRKPRRYAKKDDMDWPSVESVDYIEKEFVHPQHYE